MKQYLNKKHFLYAVILSLLLSVTLLLASFFQGKEQLFLLLNTDAGNVADLFFAVFTWGGDGIMWLPLLLIVIVVLRRKDAMVLLVACFILSTIFTQGIKIFIAPDAPRPIKAITKITLIHTVAGVEVHSLGSFPSGHTATAFSIYLLVCLLTGGRWWVAVGFIYAALTGYSRVYLAQHFPADVGAGIIVAIISVWLGMHIQEYWWKKRTGKQ